MRDIIRFGGGTVNKLHRFFLNLFTSKPTGYEYFVSFTFRGGNCNAHITISKPIDSFDDIELIQKKVESNQYVFKGKTVINPIINNYKLLKIKYN